MPTETKTIQITLTIKTAQTDYEACELVEQTLQNSSLSNSEFCLDIKETKVIERKELINE